MNKPLSHPSIERVRKLAHLMDSAIKIPLLGKRVGLDPLLDAVPVGGAVVGTLISLYPIWVAYELGLKKKVMLKMGVNVAMDFLLGLLPLPGIILDAFWQANMMNLEILEEEYEAQRQSTLFNDAQPVVDVEARVL